MRQVRRKHVQFLNLCSNTFDTVLFNLNRYNMADTEPSASNAGVPRPNAANNGTQTQDASPPPRSPSLEAKVRNDGMKLLEICMSDVGLTSFRSMPESLRLDPPFTIGSIR